MLDLHRDKFESLEKTVAGIFCRLPFTPNQYTVLSFFMILACVFFMLAGVYPAALVFFIAAGMLDLVDGAVARRRLIASPQGAYLDTITDRYVEALLLFGFMLIGLPGVIFSSCVWLFLILFGSTMTTYAKAAASEKKLCASELKGGLMSRGERMILYAAALLMLNFSWIWVTYIIIGLAVLTNVTALQSISSALKRDKKC